MANEVKQEIFRLYKQGLSAREIMERLRLKKSNRTIGRWLRDAGISRPPGGSRCKWPLSVREQVFARYMKVEFHKKNVFVLYLFIIWMKINII